MSHSVSTTKVETSREGNVVTIRFITDGGGVNILSSRVMGELGQAIERVAEERQTRFVVLRGTGKTFFAGADIAELSHFDEDSGYAFGQHGHHVFDAIEALPQVTFALLNGHALGGGCELAMACDFRIAVGAAKLGQPECRLGLIPGWGGTKRLPRLVGPALARKLLFSGEALAAEQALAAGLVDEVVPSPEQLDEALGRWVQSLSQGSPAAIGRIKRALLHDNELDQFSTCFNCSDAQAGLEAFLKKSPPPWANS